MNVDAQIEDYDYDVEAGDTSCPKCGGETRARRCSSCEDGYSDSDHDCGEDVCCCLNPEPGRCSECLGKGHLEWCPTCGWDLMENCYINGRDERERAVIVHKETNA